MLLLNPCRTACSLPRLRQAVAQPREGWWCDARPGAAVPRSAPSGVCLAGALDDVEVGAVELLGEGPHGVEQVLGLPLYQGRRLAQEHRQAGQLLVHLPPIPAHPAVTEARPLATAKAERTIRRQCDTATGSAIVLLVWPAITRSKRGMMRGFSQVYMCRCAHTNLM